MTLFVKLIIFISLNIDVRHGGRVNGGMMM